MPSELANVPSPAELDNSKTLKRGSLALIISFTSVVPGLVAPQPQITATKAIAIHFRSGMDTVSFDLFNTNTPMIDYVCDGHLPPF